MVSATLGPGAINMQLGVADATTNSTPLVAISAQVGQDREYKESHQYVDLVTMFAPITRWADGIPTARAIPEMFRKAFKLAETERPAAVYLAVPEHIDADDADYDLTPLPRNVVRAEAPVARSGAAGGRRPAKRSGLWCWPDMAPPAPTPPPPLCDSPRSWVCRSPTPFTARASCQTITPTASAQSASCVMTTSTSASTTPTRSSRSVTSSRNSTRSRINPKSDKKIIHIHRFPAEVDMHYPVDVGIIGDISASLDALRDALAGCRFDDAATGPGP